MRPPFALIAAVAATGLAVTACSGSSGSARNSGSAGSAVTINVQGGRLTAPDGRTLYYNTVDTLSTISCVGGCATAWPPLLGTPHAGSGVAAGDLSSATRPGGGSQVSYDGHPLYEFSGDSGPGTTKGSGVADGGGHWVVATTGGAAPPSSPGAPTSASGGYGY